MGAGVEGAGRGGSWCVFMSASKSGRISYSYNAKVQISYHYTAKVKYIWF